MFFGFLISIFGHFLAAIFTGNERPKDWSQRSRTRAREPSLNDLIHIYIYKNTYIRQQRRRRRLRQTSINCAFGKQLCTALSFHIFYRCEKNVEITKAKGLKTLDSTPQSVTWRHRHSALFQMQKITNQRESLLMFSTLNFLIFSNDKK